MQAPEGQEAASWQDRALVCFNEMNSMSHLASDVRLKSCFVSVYPSVELLEIDEVRDLVGRVACGARCGLCNLAVGVHQ